MTQFGVVPQRREKPGIPIVTGMVRVLPTVPVEPAPAPEPEPELDPVEATLDAMRQVLATVPTTPISERIGRQVALAIIDHHVGRVAAAMALRTIVEAVDDARKIVRPVIARDALELVPTFPRFYRIFTELHIDAPRWTVGELALIASKATGVSVLDMCSERRERPLVRARHLGMWLAKRFTRDSFPSIGRFYGGRDHTTALYGCEKTKRVVDERNIDAGDDPEEWARQIAEAMGEQT